MAAARRVTRAFAESAGADENAVGEIVLCMSEAMTNAVVHAYGGAPGEVEIEAFERGGSVTIHVRDFGVGMRPRFESPGAGVGLAVIARLASTLATGPAKDDGAVGTEVVMRFELAGQRPRRPPTGA